jgi:hypothetical protein
MPRSIRGIFRMKGLKMKHQKNSEPTTINLAIVRLKELRESESELISFIESKIIDALKMPNGSEKAEIEKDLKEFFDYARNNPRSRIGIDI